MAHAPSIDLGEIVRAFVRQRLEHEGINPTQLARKAGINQPTLTRLLNGETNAPNAATIRALVRDSPVAVPILLRNHLDQAPAGSLEQDVNYSSAAEGIPVWGVHPVAPDGEFRFNAVPLLFLPRPSTLQPGRKLAAFYAPDETMSPRWAMGELVLMDNARPPTIGGYCVVEMSPTSDPNAPELFLFRRYDGARNGELLLARPDGQVGELRVPRARQLSLRRVLNWQDIVIGS